MISLRPATIDDIPLLEHWENQAHVKAAGIEDWPWQEELPDKQSWRLHLIAQLDSIPIGFIQIIDPALDTSHYWGDIAPNHRAIDIWIGDPTKLGQGYGTEMMTLALRKCFTAPEVIAVVIDPLETNKNAQRFYQRLGFKFVENRLFDDDKCSVFRLDRKNWIENNTTGDG